MTTSPKLQIESQGEVPCTFVTGVAGSGKTFLMKQRITEDPYYGKLTATTGIAAINLGTTALNSVLKFFDTDSMEEAFLNGWLESSIAKVADDAEDETFIEADEEGEFEVTRKRVRGHRNLVIDEVSMLDAKQLDMIYQCAARVNERRSWHGKEGFGIVLTGDFCQLPPVKAPWAFEAQCWPHFEASTERLTKV